MRSLVQVFFVGLCLWPSWLVAQTTTVTGGAWEAATTWSGGVIPRVGARAIVAHPVTIATAITVGTSPGAGGPPAVTVTAGGSLTVNPGAALVARGDVVLNDAPLRLGAGSRLEFDAASAVSPASSAYRLRIGAAHDQSGAVLLLEGAPSARCSVRSSAAGGAAPAAITGGDFLGGGIIRGRHCDLIRLGSAAVPAVEVSPTGSTEFSLENVTFEGSGGLRTRYTVGSGASFTLKNTTFRGTLGDYSAELSFYTAPEPGRARLIEGNVFDLPVRFFPARRAVIRDNIFGDTFLISPDDVNEGWLTFARNFVRNRSMSETILAADSVDNYWLTDPAPGVIDYNPHFVQALTWRSSVIDGDIFEYTGTDDNGDCIGLANPPEPATLTIRRSLVLPNGAGSTSGTLFSALGGPNVTIKAEHNTYIAGVQGTSVGETYPGHRGLVASFRSNIAWDTTARGFLIYDSGPNEAVVDLVAAVDADYNTSFRTLDDYSDLEFSVGSPGIHDVNVDPQFVDPTRDIAAWDKSLGGPGTAAHAFGALAKRNDPVGFDSRYTLANLRSYVRAGFRPRNDRMARAGHDGETIGAVGFESVVTPTPGPTPGDPTVTVLRRPKVKVRGQTATVTVSTVAAGQRYIVELTSRGRPVKVRKTTRREVVYRNLRRGSYRVRYGMVGQPQRSPSASFKITAGRP